MHQNGKIFRPSVPVVLSTSLLPDEYQQVEYIENSGVCYIDTGILDNLNIDYEVKLNVHQPNFSFGVSTSPYIEAYVSVSGSNLQFMNWGVFKDCNFSLDTDVVVKKDVDSCYIDNTLYSIGSGTGISSLNWFLFNLNRAGSPFFTNSYSGKIYYAKFYISGELFRYFIPCYRKLDNVAGMFDIVNNVFYTNLGSGSFVVGQDCTEVLQ